MEEVYSVIITILIIITVYSIIIIIMQAIPYLEIIIIKILIKVKVYSEIHQPKEIII
jgi:hypothetical protein